MAAQVLMIPMLKDSYAYLVRDEASRQIAIIDAAVTKEAIRAAEEWGGSVRYILNTHHHAEVTGGNLKLKEYFKAPVLGSVLDRHRIPGLDIAVHHGEELRLGETPLTVLATPGHTRGHIVFWLQRDQIIFTGDTLCSMGCGSLFEGTAEDLAASLHRLQSLPDATKIYCAHEYTEYFLAFALSLQPKSPALLAKKAAVKQLKANQQPTVPTTILEEKQLNPYMKHTDNDFLTEVGLAGLVPPQALFEIIEREDHFYDNWRPAPDASAQTTQFIE
jgi:hydroxyacylglutathione hydrolase